MRLCWNDGFRCALGKFSLEDAKFYHDIGFRVVGANLGGVLEATEADIEHARNVYRESGLMPGPMPIPLSLFKPDPAEMEIEKQRFARALYLAGKLGCPAIQPSAGSMNPKSIWQHHKDNFTPKAMDLLVKTVRELAPVARDNNCVISPETTQWTIVHDIASMREFVDRCNSPYVRVSFDFVNHMNAERVYDSGRYIRCAVATLGDRIGMFHVKDVQIQQDALLVLHLNEAPMGSGLLDEEALIRVSTQLAPWKTFSMEHIRTKDALKPAYDHIQGIAERIGHRWSEPAITHTSYIGKPEQRATARQATTVSK